LRTRDPWAVEQRNGRMGCVMQPSSLSKAPPEALSRWRLGLQVLDDARIVHCCRHTAKSPDMIAKRLIGEALDHGATDNVTVVVVFLRDLA